MYLCMERGKGESSCEWQWCGDRYLLRFAVAEEDCTLSLSLDQTYLKAWLRRATAREKLGKLVEAQQGEGEKKPPSNCVCVCSPSLDFEKVLEMEPGNKLAKSELASIQKVALPLCLHT